jgi:hypothetical protein
MPLARGVQLTYLHELNGEAIAAALKKGTSPPSWACPALWSCSSARIMKKATSRRCC